MIAISIIIISLLAVIVSVCGMLCWRYYGIARDMEASARRGWSVVGEIKRVSLPEDVAHVMAEAALDNERNRTA
jgi:hypothetical protein